MRIFKLLMIVTIVAVVTFAAVAWFSWRGAPANTNVAPVVVNSSGDTNTVQTPPITAGDIPLDASVSYRGLTFILDSALRTNAFRRTQSDDGQQFVVVFFKPFTIDPPTDAVSWVSQDVVLTTSGGLRQRPVEVGLPKLANQSGGFISYQVPVNATGAVLVFGSGADAATVSLGF
jgi:hypothetical protein